MNSNKKSSSEKKEAVALKYNPQQDSAPTVIAKGKKELAQQIIKQAQESDIPITEDQDLVKILLQLNLGEEIPEELYQVVAEILSFIYDLEDLA
ncbi:EscU/YscU/HrcU family type III secretion system export apparatus switch protein [Natroniella acetigena]|nr:EscU/YscU/HrcU family type III secretion system export apparatus switch protein [Natroniella acetigena]MCK8826895.1 EscU/YscU/HrcU family type III secretion system export apparatus switch protein [Natroniella acetigena]